MISARYAWAAAGVLLLAAVPTVLNVYRQPPELVVNGLEEELGAQLGDFAPGPRRAATIEEHFGARDFATRRYGAIELFAARSYDGKKLFHFPELALTYGRAATAVRDNAGVRVIEFAQDRDVHMAAYALLYGTRAVEEPIRFHLSILPELFLGNREPMTLVYVQGPCPRGGEKAFEAELKALLAKAVAALRE
ncbi:MAG: hypothetical protein ACHQ1G_03555 [Planctomycetota bacterium]